MEKQWFVLHTLTGQENKVQRSIEARVKIERMEDYIGRCVIPTEKVSEKKNGKKRTIVKKFFPGYVLCELALYDEARGVDDNGRKAIYERTWQFLRETPGMIGFVGSDRPMPLKKHEVDAILLDKPNGAQDVERPKFNFSVEDTVKINDGAFMGLTGQVSMVDPDKGKLKVEV
ncbi:MAG: transcription termination/antitermination protein NusG, partial [Kiritimatiellae bacterium]|nr:transcription termination/antitermination protein NusG [Kiritimatiellia bacterium]